MRNGVPFAYSLYRMLWTFLHLAFVGIGVVAFIVWFVHDNQGATVIASIWRGLTDAQSTVANAISFPWGE